MKPVSAQIVNQKTVIDPLKLYSVRKIAARAH